MNERDADHGFAGAVPALYESLLVPLIFEPYAVDLARRVAMRPASRVLEVAAGTGVVTRRLAAALPDSVAIVATDLNQPMLDRAALVGTSRPVHWRQADAMALPFESGAFDVVVCQFGAMFFPDKAQAYSEARRVLKPGGAFIFNVWDRIEANEFAHAAATALAVVFPHDPPLFLAHTPHGYHDAARISRELRDGGFLNAPQVELVTRQSRAHSARDVAVAYCQGTPLRNEIEARGKSRLGEATDIVEQVIRGQFGTGTVDGRIQAYVISVEA